MLSLAQSWNLTIEPAWPWSVPSVGTRTMVVVALILIGVTIWTYSGVREASRRRIATLIALRLSALVIACCATLRPSLAVHDELPAASTLVVAIDFSESMTIQDQHDNQSRWEYLRRLLEDCEPELHQLRDTHNITIALHRFAGEVSDFEPDTKANGKRTDFGEMLHALYERYGSERFLRGLVVLSDGADNGVRYPALSLAAKWRSLACPIHTFAFGQTTTSSSQRDIVLTAIRPDPSPVATKGKLAVKGTVDAAGFDNQTVRVHLLLNDKEVAAKDQQLTRTTGNEVEIVCDAPAEAGEIKVTLAIDPVPGEITKTNNEITTYVTVTQEGISVLYVEGKYRAWEPKFIRHALSRDPSIRLYEAVRLTDEPAGDADLFQFEKQHYDVIIVGDVTARRLSAGNPQNLAAINKLVYEKGTGFMMFGGFESFGNSDWQDTEIAKLLPVFLDASGQMDQPIRMMPTLLGLQHFVLRLADSIADNATVWSKLPRLDGMTRLGRPKPGAITLAETPAHEPILVGQLAYGAGRTLAFAGDTTWKWWRTKEGERAGERFWQQVVLWLAKRDEANGNVLVLPDTRRLPAGGKLAFGVKLRGKGGVEIPEKDAHFDVSVIAPQQVETKVPTVREQTGERGSFWKTEVPGEYVLVARAWGTDVDGKPLQDLPPAKARFVVYQDDAEMSRQAADHDFLSKLASQGGGKLHPAEDLRPYLRELASAPLPQSKYRPKVWPDWRRTPSTKSLQDQSGALTSSGLLACFMLFVALLCLEWFLRRRWGLV